MDDENAVDRSGQTTDLRVSQGHTDGRVALQTHSCESEWSSIAQHFHNVANDKTYSYRHCCIEKDQDQANIGYKQKQPITKQGVNKKYVTHFGAKIVLFKKT